MRTQLQHLLVLLVKAALAPEAPFSSSWEAQARAAQASVREQQGQGTTDEVARRLDSIWDLSVKEAESDSTVRRDETVNPMLPTMCPLKLDALTAADFDLAGSVQAIRDTASFG